MLQEIDHLLEVALEAGGGDDLENPSRFAAGVPEGVPLAPWLSPVIAARNSFSRAGSA